MGIEIVLNDPQIKTPFKMRKYGMCFTVRLSHSNRRTCSGLVNSLQRQVQEYFRKFKVLLVHVLH